MNGFLISMRQGDDLASAEAESIIFRSAQRFGVGPENRRNTADVKSFFVSAAKAAETAPLLILTAAPQVFLKVKKLLLSALSFETEENERVKAMAGENSLSALMPRGAEVFTAAGAELCGFAAESGGQRIVFLPLDLASAEKNAEELAQYLIKSGCAESQDSAREKAENAPPFVAIASTPTAVYLGEYLSDDISAVFVETELKREKTSPKDYAAELANEARKKAGAQAGACVTLLFSSKNEEENLPFVFIAVSDGKTAKVKRIFAEEGEAPRDLAKTACKMLAEMLEEHKKGALFIPDEPSGEGTAKISADGKQKISRIFLAVLAAAAVICLVLGVVIKFVGGEEPAPADNNLPAQGVSVSESDDYYHGGLLPVQESEDEETESESESESESETERESESETESESKEPPTSKPTEPASEPTAASEKPISSGNFVFTVYGRGHGVGMSQYGANSYAKQGWDYKKILTHYYTGTSVSADKNMPETLFLGGEQVETKTAIARVVQAEMGASFNPEAIKAQAVVCYTYAMFNGASCKGLYYASEAKPAVTAAVESVLGEYVSYNGSYINATFFPYSGGKTVSAKSVGWGANYPYLSGADSSPDLSLENCKSVVSIPSEEIKKLVGESYGIELTGDPAEWLKITEHDNSTGMGVGYVSKISVGGVKTLSGNQFLTYVMGGKKLRSHCFAVEFVAN